MPRILPGLAAVVATVALFATGCSPTAPSAPASAGDVSIRFTWWGNTSRHEATQKIVDGFVAEHPTIRVVTEPSDFGGYFDKLATATAAGDMPDLVTLGGAYLPEYAERDALLDLGTVSDQFPTDGLDRGAVDNGTYRGTQYGATTGVNTLAVIVNPSIFDAAGVPLPDDATWTWDDYRRAAIAVQAASPEGVYGASGGLTHDSLDLFARQRGEKLYTQDGQLGLTEQTVADFLRYTLALVRDGGAPPATVIQEQINAPIEQTLMATNKSAMMITWSNYLTPAVAASGNDLRLLRLPGESPRPGVWLQSSQFFAISARSQHPQEAALLLDHLLNSEEAGRIVLTDRGVPTNARVREAILPELSPTGRAEVEYIDAVSDVDMQSLFIGPPGSTQVQDITNRVTASVLFEQQSPEEGARQWMSESRQAIS